MITVDLACLWFRTCEKIHTKQQVELVDILELGLDKELDSVDSLQANLHSCWSLLNSFYVFTTPLPFLRSLLPAILLFPNSCLR